MVCLSVNINKFATLRNARGKNRPCLQTVTKNLVGWGVPGITVHPRPDGRHILYRDVREIKELLKSHQGVELNVEGYPSREFLKLTGEVVPHQCTLVPDPPGVLTSGEGWRFDRDRDRLKKPLSFLKTQNIRSSLFLDPFAFDRKDQEALEQLNPDRVELYTEHYASAYDQGRYREVLSTYAQVAQRLNQRGLGINAGHDLSLDNLECLLQAVPSIQEVSIGHALVCESLDQGLSSVVKRYLQICKNAPSL